MPWHADRHRADGPHRLRRLATTTDEVNEAALRASAQSQGETTLAAAEADLAARRYQLAFQRLARLDKATMESTRARYAMAEVLLGLDRPHEALVRFEALQADPAFKAGHGREWAWRSWPSATRERRRPSWTAPSRPTRASGVPGRAWGGLTTSKETGRQLPPPTTGG